MQNLTDLLRRGVITPQTYADGLSALGKERPTPTPRKRERPTPAPQKRERPTPAPRKRKRPKPAPRKHERPTPAPRLLTDKEFDKLMGEIYEEQTGRRTPAPSLVFQKARWIIDDQLRGWQMDVPEGHELGADPKSFLEGVRPQIHKKLVEEVVDLKGFKFQLALRVQLSKANQDGMEEFMSPVL